MNTRRLLTPTLAAAGLSVAAFALPAPVSVPPELAYRLPSPPAATWRVVDSTTLNVSTPAGTMEAAASASFTFAVTFAAEEQGVRASGELTDFAAQGNATPISRSDAKVGDFDLLLGPQGVTEVVNRVLQAADSDLPVFGDPTEAMFPRLPDAEVSPGDTWVDTVTSRFAGGGARIASYTYTLVGDTIVDGRPHIEVAFSADVRMPGFSPQPVELTGSDAGFFLWDVDRGLVARVEASRSYEGNVELPDGSQPSIQATAVTRVTLQT